MKIVKKVFDKLWLILAVVGVASAANVEPLVFDSLTTYYENLLDVGNPATMDTALRKEHQKFWEKLMTFKMWGTFGITMGHASAPDVNGAIGTAHGVMTLREGDHKLGGPIYIGGDIVFKNGPDVFLSGPARVKGDFNTGANGNSFYGTHCIEGVASTRNQNISSVEVEFKNDKEPIGRLAQGAAAKLGMCSYDSVPEVPTYLTIPDVPALPAGAKVIYNDINVTNTYTIDVPPNSNGSNIYDLYVGGNIIMGANSSIIVRMANNKNLVRLFISGSIIANSSSTIQVVYVDEGAQYIGDTWTNVTNPTYVKNEAYAGNVLFHCKEDIDWSAMNGGSFFQGSFLSKGKIKVGSNLVLAGQLLANELEIDHEFDGSSFRYVPFDPPVLQTAEGVKTYLVEGHEQDTVKIALDKEATTSIDFEYCFDFDGTADGKDPNGFATRADISTANIPLFNKTTQKCDNPGKAYFDVGSKNLRTPIILVANDDGIDEGTDSKPGKETFKIIIQNLNAATLKDGSHDGYITLEISDPDLGPLTFEKDTLRAVDENPLIGTVIDTLRGIHDTVGCPACVYSLSDTSHYSAYITVTDSGYVLVKDSSIFDFESIQYIDIQVHVVDAPNKMEADTTIIIPIRNVNENPILKGDDFDVDEHKPAKTVVGTIKGDDIDKVDSFRNNVFEAVGGDTLLFAVDSTGVITTKKELDYETMDTTYILVVKLRDHKDTSLYAIDTMTIHVHNVNENPKITTDTLYVTENSPKGTDVGEIKATDPDKNDTQTFTLVNDPSGCFDVASDGSVTVSEKCKGIDREKDPVIVIEVQVTDSFGATDIHKIRVVVKDVPSPKIEITDTTWTKPKEPIYTNDSTFPYCWILNSKKEDGDCADTTLKPGKNEICKEVCDLAGFEGCAEDCMTVYYSDAAPVVTIDADPDGGSATNIFTIVEKTDDADTNVYVNKTQNDIRITVKDSVTGVSKSFTVNVDLKNTVKVPQKTYDKLASVIKEAPALEDDAKGAVRTPVNGTEVNVSYTTKVAGAEVSISYLTDNKGNVIKQTVINDKGKEESIEVMKVSYETEIDGKKVTVSYYADAVTGSLLVKDAYGRLMTESAASAEKVDAGVYSVSYNNVNAAGDSVTISYAVDKKGEMVKNSNGDIGYSVSYTYVNEYGNSAKRSIFMVLDQKGPEVEIRSPVWGAVIRSNSVAVEWTVDGKVQDTLVVQGLEKGINYIVRYYCDKAGNKASDTVFVMMKDGKDVNVSIEKPVTVVTKDRVSEYYKDESSRPKPGQTYAVSIQKPTLDGDGEEVETLIGGTFGSRAGSGEEPYKNVKKKNATHLGPTLALDIKLPTVSDGNNHGSVGGLATLDDLMSGNLIPLEGVDAANSKKVSVEEYVAKYCEAGFDASDIKRANLYRTHAKIKIWVYTTLGNFVDYYSFSQDLNDPDYTNEAGMLRMFFEMKPDADGNVRSEKGKLYATGAYVYKVEAKLRSDLRCTLPPVDDVAGKKMGDVIKSDDDLLKPFGYKRPAKK